MENWNTSFTLKVKVEFGKHKGQQDVLFDPSGFINFGVDELQLSNVNGMAFEKFGTALAISTKNKKNLKLVAEKSSVDLLADAADLIDGWCIEKQVDGYKPLKNKNRRKSGLLGRTRRDTTGSVNKTLGQSTLSALKTMSESVPSTSSEDEDSLLPESLEAMKTGFLQYRRMQLKAQVVGSEEKGTKSMENELNEVAKLEEEKRTLKKELEDNLAVLGEREKSYFADGKELAAGFVEIAKHVKLLGKGPLAQVFGDLQAEYTKTLGLDDSSDDEVYKAEKPLRKSITGTPEPMKKKNSLSNVTPERAPSPTLKSSAKSKRSIPGKIERSDSTIGWIRAKPVSSSPSLAAPTAAPISSSEGVTERFRSVVGTLEAALYLNRPMDGILDAIKEKGRRLQSEIDEIKSQMDNAELQLAQQGQLMNDVKNNLSAAKGLGETLSKVSTGEGASELRKWIADASGNELAKECVKQMTDAKLPRKQTYFDIVVDDYAAPRDAIELAEDGSLFSCRPDVLFALLVSGKGESFQDFEISFMYGFRAWMSPVSLLERFIEVFCTTPNDSKSMKERMCIGLARQRVLLLLKTWIEIHEYDAQEKRFSSLMHSFLDTVSIAGFDEEAKSLRGLLTGNFFYDDGAFDQPYPVSVVPADLKNFTFLELDPLEVARQITLQDAALYQGMQTRELLDCQWTKAGGTKAPTVLVITKRFNAMAAWVVGIILREEDLTRRVQTVANMIKIAQSLLELQNFNGVMQIIASLSKTEVVRLKKTMAGLPRDSKKSFDNLRKLLDKNCAKLRELYKDATPPCLPYIGTYMTDLTFIGEMKPRLPNGNINCRKLLLQATSLQSLLGRRGQILYRLKEVKEIRDFIGKKEGVVFASEDEAYNQSLQLEPREKEKN